ncbi:MAG: 2-amino-4-hydroxy-6-hydroxymethyldihydropteridine diphosphokinase [Candidatus Marsarchaeota archaeon]|nr:2-amino-4-hydroxy-6-hydroxymethyldihydropteridine diphosphokinase [Candidatus Marsarchaeota archaeon]
MAYLRGAVQALPKPVRCSRVFETAPVDTPQGSGQFLNMVAMIDFTPDHTALLDLIGQLETEAKRVRDEPNGPRTLDVDVIYVDGMESDDPAMTVPHPRCHKRAFVIAPLMDLDPQLARVLSPELSRLVGLAERDGSSEVYPGVLIYSEAIC